MYKQLKARPTSALWRALALHRGAAAQAALQGNMLVIDPSIGSTSSRPGFAIYSGGHCIDSGVIDVGSARSTHDRLWEIGRSLREDFQPAYNPDVQSQWDVLVLEDVPHKRWSKSKWGYSVGNTRQQVQLHRACGAVHASVHAPHALAVHPSTWHLVVPDDYVKSDAGDARAMGETVLQYSRAVLHALANPPKPRKGGRK